MKTIFKILLFSIVSVTILPGCDALFLSRPSADPESVFESLWKSFDEDAANLEERNVDWREVYALYRPMIGPETTDEQLHAVFREMLARIDDSHVGLTAPHFPYFNASRMYREKIDRELFDLDVIRGNYLEQGFKQGTDVLYGKIAGRNIAYIHIRLFKSHTMPMLSEMLDRYPDASGYIIDLRQNGGGNHTFGFDHMGRFTDQPRYVFRSKTRNGPGRDHYTPWHEWYLKPSGRYVGERPIVVLTDRYTPSAAERVVMAFKTLPNATIMGDTTNGTFGTKIPRELPNGWYFTLSVQKVEMFDGRSYEGIGLAPDIFLKNDLTEIGAGFDRVVETAIATVLKQD